MAVYIKGSSKTGSIMIREFLNGLITIFMMVDGKRANFKVQVCLKDMMGSV